MGAQRILKDPQQANPPGVNRDLGAGQGQQRGVAQSQETMVDSGTRRGAQIQVAEADGWRVQVTSRWAGLSARRVGGERVQTEIVLRK